MCRCIGGFEEIATNRDQHQNVCRCIGGFEDTLIWLLSHTGVCRCIGGLDVYFIDEQVNKIIHRSF